MKKYILVVFAVVCVMWAGLNTCFAAEVTLVWNPVDFEVCYSDPAQSGYRVYVSRDSGQTRDMIGGVPADQSRFAYTESALGPACYYVTAYNQFGESGYSEPACATVGAVPATPKPSVTVTVTVTVNP